MGFVLRGRIMPRTSRCPARRSIRPRSGTPTGRNWAEVDRLLNDDVVRGPMRLAGTPAQVRARLEEYRAIGLDEIDYLWRA